MDVRRLDTAAFPDWDEFVRSDPAGSPFHLLAWRRAVERAFGLRPHYLVAIDGGVVHGVLPLFEVRHLKGGRALVSVAYGVYGGICARSAEARRALLSAASDLASSRGAGYVELRHRAGQALDLPTKALYMTFARAITASEQANLNAIPRKQRRMTRQGARHGLRAEVGRDPLDAFWEVYARSVHTLGSPVFPRRFFHAIADEFGKDCELLTVWKDGRLVAGVLSLYHEDQVLPFYGGALREAFAYAVNDFMYWELMCHAARAGCRVFDFGRSREGTGPYHFKRHWGFEPEPLPYQYVLRSGASIPNMNPSNSKMRWAIEAWKRLPFRVTRYLGPLLTRYLP
jgi:FemAB-related protein (PEP-CTERM system-associated)